MQKNNPKTIEEVIEYVESNVLLGMLETEYRGMREVEIQLEYLATESGRNIYGPEQVDAKLPYLKIELEKQKGRFEFLKEKLQQK